MTLNRKDLLAGAIFVAVGGYFALHAALSLKIGTASRMGTGYFPLLLGIALTGLGLAIGASSIRGGNVAGAPVPWRAVLALTLAPILFGITVRPLGLLPASLLCVAVSAAASRRMTWATGAALSVGLTAFCILVFSYGLGVPFSLISPQLLSSGPFR